MAHRKSLEDIEGASKEQSNQSGKTFRQILDHLKADDGIRCAIRSKDQSTKRLEVDLTTKRYKNLIIRENLRRTAVVKGQEGFAIRLSRRGVQCKSGQRRTMEKRQNPLGKGVQRDSKEAGVKGGKNFPLP